MSSLAELERWHSVTRWTTKRGFQPWPLSDVPGIRELQLEVGPGRCPFCERVLSRSNMTRPPVICFSADCAAEYQRTYDLQPRRRLYNARRLAECRARNLAAGLTVDGRVRRARGGRWYSRH